MSDWVRETNVVEDHANGMKMWREELSSLKILQPTTLIFSKAVYDNDELMLAMGYDKSKIIPPEKQAEEDAKWEQVREELRAKGWIK